MRIVDRYLFKRVISGYLFLVLTFLLLYVLIDISSHLEDILKHKASIETIAKYYLFFIPQIFMRISPLSFLVSTLYCIGDLNKNNEVLSLRSQGMSVFGISKIFVITAVVLSMVSLFISDNVIPKTNRELKRIQGYKEKKVSESDVVNDFAFYSESGAVIFAVRFYPHQKVMTDVNLFYHNEVGEITKEIVASRIVYDDGMWIGENVSIYRIKQNKISFDDAAFFQEKIMDFSERPKDILKMANLEWSNLSLKSIQKQIDKFSVWRTQKIIRLLKAEFHKKIALSFATLFLLLGTLPFALKIKQRRVGLTSIGLAILMAFVYYLLFSLGLAVGKLGLFAPLISCWISNIFFGVSGIIGLALLD